MRLTHFIATTKAAPANASAIPTATKSPMISANDLVTSAAPMAIAAPSKATTMGSTVITAAAKTALSALAPITITTPPPQISTVDLIITAARKVNVAPSSSESAHTSADPIAPPLRHRLQLASTTTGISKANTLIPSL